MLLAPFVMIKAPSFVDAKKVIALSMVFLPLNIHGQTVGVLSVHSYKSDIYDEKGIELLNSIAADLAMALTATRTIEALRDSEDHLKVLFDEAPDGIYVHDLRGVFVNGNRASEKITGYNKEELIGTSFVDGNLLSGEYLQRAIDNMKKNAQGLPAGPDEYALNKKDGGTIDVEINTFPVNIKGNTYVLGIIRDITARKKTQAALEEESTRRRVLMEQSRDGIVVLDENGKVYEANQRYAEMLGYSPEEVRQIYIWDWDTQYTPDQLIEMLRVVDESGDHFETQHRRKDGSIYDVEISTNGANIGGQKLIFCVCRDISERKRAENVLRHTNERLQGFIASSPVAIISLDTEHNVQVWNPAAEKMFGWKEVEVVGKPLPTIPPGMESKAFKIIQSTLSGQVYSNVETKRLRKDNTLIDVNLTTAPLRGIDGEIIGVTGIFMDITDRKRAEGTLRKLATA